MLPKGEPNLTLLIVFNLYRALSEYRCGNRSAVFRSPEMADRLRTVGDVAGAVILPEDCEILWLNDSKQLSEKKREALYDEIMEKALAVSVGMASPARIDEINILQATYEAMREAIAGLKIRPQVLLNDAVKIPQVEISQVPIIKGDAKSLSIAASSVIAKVTRDRLMKDYDKLMPEYGFAKHKGYGSAAHMEAIRKFGSSPIHRQSFIKNII